MTSPTTFPLLDLDNLPDSLARDGYRPYVGTDPRGGICAAIRLVVDGETTAEREIWSGPETAAGAALLERLAPVLQAVCRFLNTDTRGGAANAVNTIGSALIDLPHWSLGGVEYLAASPDFVDVVFDVPGRERVLRVVEDEFAEVLDAAQLQRWLESTPGRYGDDDGPPG